MADPKLCILLHRSELEEHRAEYAMNGEGMYIYEVQHPKTGCWLCLDATRAFNTLGRLVNHSCNPNLRAKAAQVKGSLRLGFLAARNIPAGEELYFDYGIQPRPPPWLRRRLKSM